MNKTFKIVFNKARGALMVANELTGSVQKKGTRTVVALAAISVASIANATIVSSWDNVDDIVGKSLTRQVYEIQDPNKIEKSAWNIVDNALTTSTWNLGALARLSKTHTTISDSAFTGNNITTSAVSASASDKDAMLAMTIGGVFFIKNGSNTFKDVAFSNNVLTSTGNGLGALVAGGAIYQDAVINSTDGKLASALTIAISDNRDVTYSGNNVISSTPDTYYGLYGTVSTAAGGFLFLDRDSKTDFNIGEGASLHIGTSTASGNMDSIASSIGIDGNKQNTGIVRSGAGTLEINSSLDKFYGTVDVNEGTLSVTKSWNIMNDVTIASGATLKADNIELTSSPTSLEWNGTTYKEGDGHLVVTTGTVTVKDGGTLTTKIGSVFTDANDAFTKASLNSTDVVLKNGFAFENNSTLSITDNGTFSSTLYNNVIEKSNASFVNFLNASLAKAANDTSDDLSIKADTAVKALEGFNTVTIDESKSLTIQGDSSTTSVNTIELSSADSSLKVENNSDVNVNKLTGTGVVSIGQADGSGASMTIGELAMTAGAINVDPEYGHSTLQINSIADDTLNTNIIAGHGAFVAIGANADAAKSAVTNLDNFDAVQSVFYVANPIIAVQNEFVHANGNSLI